MASVLTATGFGARQDHLGAAYQALVGRFNAINPGVHVDPSLRPFHDRAATIPDAERCVEPALVVVRDRALRDKPLIGGIDQFGDSTDLLTRADQWRELRRLYVG